MRLINLVPIVVLGMSPFLAMADDVNCGSLANSEARQECLQRKYDNTPDCAKLANPEARKECAEYKVNNNGDSVDCSKLATAEARRQCAKQMSK